MKILNLILNVFKYPFLGLFFVIYKVISIILFALKGFIYLFYFPIDMILIVSKSIKKNRLKNETKEQKEKRLEKERLKEQRLEKKKEKIELKKQIAFEKSEKKRLAMERRDEIQREKMSKKIKKDLDRQKKKEDAMIKKLEEAEELRQAKERIKLEKKKAKEARKKLTFGQKIKAFFAFIPTIPKKIMELIKRKINNISFVRDIKNRRDINREALMIEFGGKDAERSNTKIVYVYEAKNPEGKIVKDHFAAYSKVEVHSFLLSEGYEVYSIKTNKMIQILYANASNPKFKTKDLIFFLTQLSTYIKAGIPLVDSLKILSRQYDKKKTYKTIFRTMIYDLSMGANFSDAMEKQGVTFPKLLVNMVKAAEMTGELTEALDDMANYYTESEQTKKQMVNALTYPAIVFIFAIAVIVFILVYVIPKFTDIYMAMDASKIPAFTKVVIAVSDFIKTKYMTIIIVLVLFIIAFILLYKYSKVFRTFVQWTLMHVPVIGDVIIFNEVTMFTKTFASLLAHNVYITDSMEILNKITNNEVYKMIILETVTNLAKGDKISLAFKDHWAFPIPAYEMLVTGESTGQLAEMMSKVSSYYQSLHKDIVAKVKAFIEPILIVFLTTMVGIIVLAIVIPMFGMYETVQSI